MQQRVQQTLSSCAKFVVAVTAAVMLLAACGGSTRPDDKPAGLVDLKATLQVTASWDYDLGAGPDGSGFKLRPIVVGDFVFAASRDGNLVRLNLADGSEGWVTETEEMFSAGPAFDDGVVAVGTDQGRLLAFKATTGEQLWAAKVPSEILAAPVMTDGVVVVSTSDGNLLAYSAADGSRLWSQQQVQPALTLRGSSTPLSLGGAVFAGFDNGKVAGFDPKTGKQFFARPVANPSGRTQIERIVDVNADLVSDTRNLYAATYQGKTVRINLQSGNTDWDFEQSVEAGIALGRLSLFATNDKGHVVSLSKSTGTKNWDNQLLHRRGVTGPAVIEDYSLGDIVVVADKSGYVHFMTGEKGVLLARSSIGGGIWVAPVVNERTVLVLNDDGELVALSVAASGAQ